MEIAEIRNILPHRYPFLLIDRILEVGEKESANYLGEGLIISDNFGIIDAANLTDCETMSEKMGTVNLVGCNTTVDGAPLILQGSQVVGDGRSRYYFGGVEILVDTQGCRIVGQCVVVEAEDEVLSRKVVGRLRSIAEQIKDCVVELLAG